MRGGLLRGTVLPNPTASRSRRRGDSDEEGARSRSRSRTGLFPAFPPTVPALVELKLEVVNETFNGFDAASLQDWKKRFCTPGYFQERMVPAEEGKEAWFYYVGDRRRPRAMAALKPRGNHAYLGDLYVRERGQGLGTNLLRDLVDRSRENRMCSAVADCFSCNASALVWLESEGFVKVGSYQEPSLGIEVCRLAKDLG